jgi:hypothetical protein
MERVSQASFNHLCEMQNAAVPSRLPRLDDERVLRPPATYVHNRRTLTYQPKRKILVLVIRKPDSYGCLASPNQQNHTGLSVYYHLYRSLSRTGAQIVA